MSTAWQKAIWISAGATMGIALSVALNATANKNTRTTIPVDELRTFSEVFARIKSDYVEPVSDKKLIEQAISGMVNSLDPHSSFLDEMAFQDMRTTTTGKFGGIGIEIGVEDDYIKVVSPIDDTPAARAGIRAGDLITKVDDESTRGLSTTKAVEKMRGVPGSKVRLEVFRKNERLTHNFTLTREQIKIQAIKASAVEPGIAYIRVRTFNETTTADLSKALTELNKQASLQGVVLDLRNNPGGLLNAAVGVSATFLPKDALVVYTEGRVEGTNTQYIASPRIYAPRSSDVLANAPAVLKTVPIVVLTNGASASASEIVAGALQDHRRAVVMGTTTFGKGSVQSVVSLSPTTGVKLTTSRYFTPNGRSIQGTGIEPDVAIEQLTTDGVLAPKLQREKDLSQHLVGKNEKKDDPVEEDNSDAAQEARLHKAREDAKKLKGFEWGNEKDFLFVQAVNQLKGRLVERSTVERKNKDKTDTVSATKPQP